MTRRGFTLLETMLAAALGTLIVAAALSAMTVALRADDSLARRAESDAQLARLHRVMQRTFSTLRMAEGSLGTPPIGPDRRTPVSPEEHERILLAGDPPPDVRLRLAPDPRDPSGRVQRLDVVLSAPPIAPLIERTPQGDPLGEFDPASLDDPAADTPANAPADPAAPAASADATGAAPPDDPAGADGDLAAAGPRDGVRGSFMLYPTESADSQAGPPLASSDEASDEEWPGWSLWWVPESGTDAVEVARGLVSARWRVFKRDAMQDQLIAWAAEQLPAYVELEASTVAGGYASYLFEVAWTTSPDPAVAPADPALDADPAADPADGEGAANRPTPVRVRPGVESERGPAAISEGGR